MVGVRGQGELCDALPCSTTVAPPGNHEPYEALYDEVVDLMFRYGLPSPPISFFRCMHARTYGTLEKIYFSLNKILNSNIINEENSC